MDGSVSLAEWASAAGTMLGTLVVGGGLWYEMRQHRLERADGRAAQARLILADFRKTPARPAVWVRNFSAAPIYDLHIWIAAIPYGALSPGHLPSRIRRKTEAKLIPILGPGEVVDIDNLEPEQSYRDDDDLWVIYPALQFTDHAGHQWRRICPHQPVQLRGKSANGIWGPD